MTAEQQEELPRQFGDYTLLALLGRGGMGDVYLATKSGIQGIARRCVVKTLRAGFGQDQEYVGRFLDEARVVVQLHHKNICPVFDVGSVQGQYFLAMEYLAGRDLRSVQKRAGEEGTALGTGLSLFIMSEVLEALDYAHRSTDPQTGRPLQLVHRDVSPQNIMIGFEGDVRLIDFGLAASTLKSEETAPNVVMGKVAYMSVEQLHGEQLDGSADQFAAAVIAYELFTGKRFYGDRSSRDVYAIAAAGGFRPEPFNALPSELRELLDRALQADANKRFPSCGDMRDQLEAYRYAHSVRGDGPALRTLMHKIFAADIAVERKMLATLGAGTAPIPLAVSGIINTSKPVPGSQPSVSQPSWSGFSGAGTPSANDPSQPSLSLGPTEPTMANADTVRTSRGEMTERVAHEDSSSSVTRSRAIRPAADEPTPAPVKRIAAAAAVLVTAGVIAFLAWPRDDADVNARATDPIEVPVLDTVDVETKPIETKPIDTKPVETKPIETKPIDTKPVESKPSETVETKPSDTKPVEKKPVEKKPRPPDKRATPPPPPPPPPAPPPPVTTTKPAPPARTAPVGVKLEWLAATCPKVKCAVPLLKRVGDWAMQSPEDVKRFREDTQACVDVCAK